MVKGGKPPARVGGYDIELQLHATANTRVYRARRTADGVAVVLKLPGLGPQPALTRARGKILHESALLDAVGSAEGGSGIPRRLDLGIEVETNLPVLVLEDRGGTALSERLTEGPLPVPEAVRIGLALTEVLGRVHRAEIVHKDVNPSNVLVLPDGGIELVDFGIASRIPRERQEIRRFAELEGTLATLAPEQTGRMNRAIDHRADFYGLGMTLYILLTGAPAFTGADPMEIVHGHIAGSALSPSVVRSDVPVELSAIVLKLLRKMPEDRYQSIHGILHDLRWVAALLASGPPSIPFAIGACDVSAKLELPQKLYGREQETTDLLAAFHRVGQGASELVTVSGFSGIGKSSLVGELQRPILRRRGYFATGKFDQFKRETPYGAVAQAMRHLCRDLLLEPSERLAAFRDRLVGTLGADVSALAAHVPEIERVTGIDAPPQPVAGPEAQDRLFAAFRRFFGVFGSFGHPVVVFLDDLQWADPRSLALLEFLTTSHDLRMVLVVASYRDNEVYPTHPLVLTLEQITEAGVFGRQDIVLGPLDREHVHAFVRDALGRTHEDARGLSTVLCAKTHGNPFFVAQLLLALHDRGHLYFATERGSWAWDADAIASVGSTSNVVDLLIARIQRVSPRTQRILEVAACVGSRFDLRVLAAAEGRSLEETASDLFEALREGFVVPLDAKYAEATFGPEPGAPLCYRFSHDRVQQSAYALTPAAARAPLRLEIGRLLLRGRASAEQGSVADTTDILGHFVAARDLIVDPAERREVASLALDAGKRARAALSYDAAVAALDFGLALLPEDRWTTCQAETSALTLELAQAAFLGGALSRAEELFDAVIAHAPSVTAKAEAFRTRIDLCELSGRYADGVAHGVRALALYDVHLPMTPTREDVAALVRELDTVLDGRAIASLADAPPCADPALAAPTMILLGMFSTSYFISGRLYRVVALTTMIRFLRHGRTPAMAFACLGTASVLCGRGDHAKGFAFGQLGFDLAEKSGIPTMRAKAHFQFGDLINFRQNHLRTDQDYLRKSFQLSVEAGDPAWASYAACHLVANDLVLGKHVDAAHAEAVRWLEHVRRVKSDEMECAITAVDRVFLSLAGATKSTTTYDSDDGFEETAFEAQVTMHHSACVQAYLHHHRTIAHYLLGNYALARQANAKAAPVRWAIQGQPKIEEHVFFEALLATASILEASAGEAALDDDARAALLAVARANDAKLARLAAAAPMNYAHKRALVAAEIARCEGRTNDAANLYDDAISLATADGYANNAAIASECALRFHVAAGRTARARGYLHEALEGYAAWGARAKVDALQRRYAALVAPPCVEAAPVPESAAHRTTEARAGDLDLLSVMKATQAIASEIHLDGLLRRLTRIVLETAGATRGLILLQRGDRLRIEAAGTAGGTHVDVMQGLDVSAAENVSQAIIAYVARAATPVVLDDASLSGTFGADPHIASGKVKSLLCAPILSQSRLVGIVYLENDLATASFDHARLEVLQILLTQIAISIDHALLYRDLEERIRERTAVLSSRERSIQLLLDAMGDGLVSVELSGHIRRQPSRMTTTWFGPLDGAPLVWEYLAGCAADGVGDTRFRDDFEAGFVQIAEDFLPFEVCVAQMPRRYERDGRIFELEYRPVEDEGKLERVLVVLRDITQALAAEHAQKDALEKHTIVARLLRDREGLIAFVWEAEDMLAQIEGAPDTTALKRALHTLKGTAGTVGFTSVAERCHALETAMADDPDNLPTPAQLAVLSQTFYARVDSIREYLGSSNRAVIELRNDEHMEIVRALREERPHAELEAIVESWRWERLSDPLERLAEQAEALAPRLGKAVATRVTAHDIRILPNKLDAVWSALLHVVRNAVDHGIESPAVRRDAGKPENAILRFDARLDPSELVIEISDDGRGIDEDAVRRAAEARGERATSEAEITAALFADGLSTAATISEISGRGVGLAAVREACERAGGSVDVAWCVGGGTTFRFTFPASVAFSVTENAFRFSGQLSAA